ncbi:hypothetical protein ACSBLW_04455 [Thioclava sp. FR2]|uniref:hypothetical protein n=1 Tax=Thioclava sp. FR2 TaxID=3445780 RepID=UPI003EBFC782
MRAEPKKRDFMKAGLWSAFFIFVTLVGAAAIAQDRIYASIPKMFGAVVEYDRSLIETSVASLNNQKPSDLLCHIAAVRLKKDASHKPPRRDLSRPDFLQFGGNWKPTPILAEGPKGKDLLEVCGAFLRVDGLEDLILNAVETPGSYYISDWAGSMFQLYAPERRIALSIRYSGQYSKR